MVLIAIDNMKNGTSKNHIAGYAAVLAAVLVTISFYTDRMIFTFPAPDDDRRVLALADYGICKVLAAAVLLLLCLTVMTLAFGKGKVRERLWKVVKCGLIYLPVIVIVLIIKLPAGYVTNDELAICENAKNLVHDTWFCYLTVYYYIVSFMIFPFTYGPIIMKALIEFFIVGYTVFRSEEYFGKKAGKFMYLLFLMYPVIAYTTSAHRLPVYFLLYLLVYVVLIFDLLEKREASRLKLFLLFLAGAVLSIWRTEGIYLVALIPILLFIVYPKLRNKKSIVFVILFFAAVRFIVSLPQDAVTGQDLSSAANDRMKPFYAYTITNMFRNGLDVNANADDLAAVDAYIPLEAIDAINDHYGDINYEDVLILIKEEFGGIRQDAGYTQYYDFTQACRHIFANNPGVFLRTRWGAFCYAALPYHITFSGMQIRQLVSFALSAVKSFAYNLFIPVIFLMILCVYSLFRKKWFTFFATGGLMAHFALVFILAPASYFKYYFPVYIMGWFYVIFLAIRHFTKKDAGGDIV